MDSSFRFGGGMGPRPRPGSHAPAGPLLQAAGWQIRHVGIREQARRAPSQQFKRPGPGHGQRRALPSVTRPRSKLTGSTWLTGGKDVRSLASTPAGSCHVHGGLGCAFGNSGRDHQQRNRFVGGCGDTDGVAGDGGEPVDPDGMAPDGEPVRDFVPFVAVDGQPLYPDAWAGVQRGDEARQFGKRVPGMRPPSSVDCARPGGLGVIVNAGRAGGWRWPGGATG